MNRLRVLRVLAGTVWIEAVRRREIYVLVLLCGGLIAAAGSLDFFGLAGLAKFYRETSLKLMDGATAVAVLLLATRQLPREFERRTIYPLLARPVGRCAFLLGKGLGVLAAAAFCYGLFMALFLAGSWWLGGEIHAALFLQHVYLQMLRAAVLAAAGFMLSLALSHDAALVVGRLLYFASGVLGSAALAFYDLASPSGRFLLRLLNYGLPQFALFDLSEKAVHAEIWPPLGAGVILALTVYALAYVAAYGSAAYVMFRRRAL